VTPLTRLPHATTQTSPTAVDATAAETAAGEYPKHEVLEPGATAAVIADLHGHAGPQPDDAAVHATVSEYPKHEVLEPFAVFDALSDVVCVTALDGTLRFLNRAGRDLLGHVGDDSALVGCLFPTHTLPARELLLDEVLPAALLHGSASGDTALLTVDGRVFPARQTVIATPASGTMPATFTIVIRDVSIERHAAARLGESQRLFEMIARNSPDLICLYDPADERVVWTNRCPHAFLGGDERDARTLSRTELHRLVHRDDRARFHATATRMASAYGDSDSLTSEVRMRTPGSHWRWIQTRATVFSRRETGAPLLLLGIATDITVRKKSEHRLIAERDAAEQASRTRGEFVARMTDEFRTALHAIVGYTSEVRLDRDRRLTARDRAHLDYAVDRSQRLLETVSDLHDFSAIEAGDVAVDQSLVDVHALMHETIVAFADHPGIVDTPLRLHLPEAAAPLLTDRLRLRQALTQLIGHTLSVSRDEPISVTLSVDGGRHSPIAIEVEYTDHSTAELRDARLFAPFQPGPSRSHTGRSAGTGVGLALTRAICEMIGCTLSLEDAAPGVRRRFRIGLPVPSPSAELAAAFPVQPGNVSSVLP
jgi:PAS domain S-box-containing protein